MKLSTRRVIAFIIDILLVTTLVSLIVEVDFLNPQKAQMSLVNDEFKVTLLEIFTNYANSNDILGFFQALSEPFWQIYQIIVWQYIWYVIFFIAYFVFFAYFTDGQTLGYKVMRIKVVDVGEKKVSLKNLFLRNIFKGSNLFMGITLIDIIIIILTYCHNAQLFTYVSFGLTFISFIYEGISIVLLFKHNRAIHDYIAKTEVIMV